MNDIRFEFPIDQEHKEWLIGFHRKQGRQWVSTAFVDGKMRMKFGRFGHETVSAPAKKRKRPSIASTSGKIRYAGYDHKEAMGVNGGRYD